MDILLFDAHGSVVHKATVPPGQYPDVVYWMDRTFVLRNGSYNETRKVLTL